jgi:hypothetical protein
MRWLAAVGWAATPAVLLLFTSFVSTPFSSLVDLAPIAIPLAVALTIAVGGRIGQVGARIGAALGAVVTALVAWIIVTGCLYRCGENSWLAPAGAAALTIVSVLAARAIRTRPPR